MKNTNLKLSGTQSLRFCAVIVTVLFAFAFTACDNGTTPSTDKPALTGTVTITGATGEDGAAMVGDNLGVNTASLGGSGTISYQWQSGETAAGNFTDINGKTGAGFDADSEWATKWIRVVVSRADNSGTVASAAVQVKHGANDLTGTVAITNNGKTKYVVGDTLGVNVSGITTPNSGFTYQWQSSDTEHGSFTDITGEAAATYKITSDMADKWIRVEVKHPSYTGNVKSAAVEVIPGENDLIGTVTITNNGKATYDVDDTLGVDLSGITSTNTGEFEYQWQSSEAEGGPFTDIPNATEETYEIPMIMEGKWIRVIVSNEECTGSLTSAAVQVSVGANDLQGTAAITNTEQPGYEVGDTLGVDVSGITSVTSGFQYKWQSSGAEIGPFTDITDETKSTYEITSDMAGKWIKVAVSHPDYTGNVPSAAIQVNTPTQSLSGSVSIPNIIAVGNNVEVVTTSLNGTGTIRYQWRTQGEAQDIFDNITGATGAAFTVPNDFTGEILSVVVSRRGMTGTVASNVVRVRENYPVLASITINERSVTVPKGSGYPFSVTITGTDLTAVDKQVTWTVSNKTSATTYITTSYLVVGSDETATQLTVKATSNLDSTKFDEVTVTVAEAAVETGNKIIITGLGNLKGEITLYIYTSLVNPENSSTAPYANANIVNGTLTVSPKTGPWNGRVAWEATGEFYIKFAGTYDDYVYTNGAPVNMDNLDSNPKYDFQNQNTIIDFSKFAAIPQGAGGKQLTISGLTSYNDAVALVELSVKTMFGSNIVANGHAVVSGGSVTVTLAQAADKLTGWTDDAECFIKLTIDEATRGAYDPTLVFVYTNADTLTTLGVTNWNSFYDNAPKFDFTSGTTFSVGFDKFVSGDTISFF